MGRLSNYNIHTYIHTCPAPQHTHSLYTADGSSLVFTVAISGSSVARSPLPARKFRPCLSFPGNQARRKDRTWVWSLRRATGLPWESRTHSQRSFSILPQCGLIWRSFLLDFHPEDRIQHWPSSPECLPRLHLNVYGRVKNSKNLSPAIKKTSYHHIHLVSCYWLWRINRVLEYSRLLPLMLIIHWSNPFLQIPVFDCFENAILSLITIYWSDTKSLIIYLLSDAMRWGFSSAGSFLFLSR